MSHFITEDCTGCTACARRCPVEAISGTAKERDAIDPDPSIRLDCCVCGNVCPKSAVRDPLGDTVPRMKTSERPKAMVDGEICSGCGFCVGICPVECIESREVDFFNVPAVHEKRCIGCGLCSTVCPKETISNHTHTAPQTTS